MSAFDDMRAVKHSRRKGCPRCGAEKNVGSVGVTLRELGPKGQIQGGSIVTSKSRSMCESCAVEVYQQLVEIFTFFTFDEAQVPA